MKKGRIIVAVFIVIALVLIALCYIPISCHTDITLYDGTGNSSVMQMDVTLYRSLFSQTTIQGTIEFEGIQYESRLLGRNPGITAFIDTEQLHIGGTAIDLWQNSLSIQAVQFNFFHSSIVELSMLQVKDGVSTLWLSIPHQGAA